MFHSGDRHLHSRPVGTRWNSLAEIQCICCCTQADIADTSSETATSSEEVTATESESEQQQQVLQRQQQQQQLRQQQQQQQQLRQQQQQQQRQQEQAQRQQQQQQRAEAQRQHQEALQAHRQQTQQQFQQRIAQQQQQQQQAAEGGDNLLNATFAALPTVLGNAAEAAWSAAVDPTPLEQQQLYAAPPLLPAKDYGNLMGGQYPFQYDPVYGLPVVREVAKYGEVLRDIRQVRGGDRGVFGGWGFGSGLGLRRGMDWVLMRG